LWIVPLQISAVWLHILTPTQTAVLIASYGIVNQSYSVWTLHHAFSWRRVLPFVAGSFVGVPIGVALLMAVSPAMVRIGVGVLLIAYASYSLLKPKIKPFDSGPVTDTGVGILNGMLGGLTGLGGVVITIWTQMRNWPKDVQRTVFQPVIMATMSITAVTYAINGAFTLETIKVFFIGLPVLAGGLWIGIKLYGRLDDAAFRKVILWLLLLSGVGLLVPLLLPR
ncbi:MAG: sulfite exporter TauE/SafE family protein, partial [Pseudolabrys sp.]